MTTDLAALLAAPEAADADFLTAVLQADATLGRDGKVVAVRSEPLGAGVGMMGTLLRLYPSYAGEADGAPASLMLKLPPPAPENRAVGAAVLLAERETQFYADLAADLPVRVPRCHWAAVDRIEHLGGLVLEDLAQWTPLDQVDGASLEAAQSAMDAAAAFHAHCWENVQAQWVPRLDQPPFDLMKQLWTDAPPALADRWGGELPAELFATAGRIAERAEQILTGALRIAPQTLCHGDYRLDNMLGAPAGAAASVPGGVAVLDWQNVHLGPAAVDLAYYLCQSLDTELRRRHERDLLARWHGGLAARNSEAARGYPIEALWADYRRMSLLVTYLPVVAGASLDFGNERGNRLLRCVLRRSFAAVADLDALELLP